MRSNECHIRKVSGVVNIHLKRGSKMAGNGRDFEDQILRGFFNSYGKP